jgi:hypothetical protein
MESFGISDYKRVDAVELDENLRRLKKKKGCELVLLELPKDVILFFNFNTNRQLLAKINFDPSSISRS